MRTPFVLRVLVCVTLLSSNLAFAQFSQQGPKLVAADATMHALQGQAVSISSDGNTAIVGGPGDNSATGAVWIWKRSGVSWAQESTKLVSSDAVGNAQQGYSVSLAADGNTALVGGRADSDGSGAAWVWARNGNVWTQQAKLVGTGAVGAAQQGKSVCLSADGNTAIVGGWTDNGQAGAAWVWARSGNVWTQQGNKLVGSDAVGTTALQGTSVALSGDGNTAIVGGENDNDPEQGISLRGAAWVWTRSGSVWTQQGPKLVGSDGRFGPGQGNSVSLSADGNTAIVAGFMDNSGIGAVWVWIRNGGTWTQQGNKLVGSGSFAPEQGFSVSLSADGNTAIVGGVGAVWVWTRSGGVWTQQEGKLVGSGAVGHANFGVSVSLSGDGKTIIAGGAGDNSNAGAAWVFVAPTQADVSVTKSVIGGPPFSAGANLNYSITVINNGPGIASSVVVSDVLSAGTTFISATPSQGTCNGTTTVSCALGGLAIDGTATINLVLKTASTPATVSNTATVTAVEVDLNAANNSSTATITTVDPASIPAVSLWTLIALAGVLALFGALRMRS